MAVNRLTSANAFAFILLATSLIGSQGCSDAGFSGRNAAPKESGETADAKGKPQNLPEEKPDPVDTKQPAPPANECDLSKDFVNLKYPPDIQKCVDSGKLYDYNEKKCFETIEKATTYDCSKAGVQQAVTKISLGTATLGMESYPGAKLIGCGERRGGKTVLIQWWVPPTGAVDKEKCAFTGNMVIGTECYVSQDPGSTAIPGASNTAEGVTACSKSN